jgi:hypothetical protein
MRLRTTTRSIAPPLTASDRLAWRSSTRLTVHLWPVSVRKRTTRVDGQRTCSLKNAIQTRLSCPVRCKRRAKPGA